MKTIITLIAFWLSLSVLGQVPSDYYDSAQGLTGYQLKSALHTIISESHVEHTYGELYTAYETSDTDYYYENDGSVLDMYSEIPEGPDSYFYNHGSNQCGNYSEEGDCYNREHIVPQSVFNKQYPMKSDVHFVVPSDGYVNGKRSNYPFGIVNNPSWTSTNGSKVGSNDYTNAYTGNAFEPIDEFKGDIARMLFYFATRYETQVDDWDFPMFNGTENQVFSEWALSLLLQWHYSDPVSQREIDRNNACYNFQNNANPFIDHPEWVSMIWEQSMAINDITFTQVSIYPNPVKQTLFVSFDEHAGYNQVIIYNSFGQQLIEQPIRSSTSVDVSNLPKGLYLIETLSEKNRVFNKFIKS